MCVCESLFQNSLFCSIDLCVCLYCAVLGQSCSALCDPMDYSPPDSSVHGILQVRILEWGAMSSSRGSSQPRGQIQVSCVAGRFFTTWATREAQERWSGQPDPPPGGLPSPGVRSRFPALQVDSLPPEPPGKPKNAGVGSLTLLQGVFPAQGSNQRSLHCRQILHQGSPWATREAPCVYTACLH